MNSIQLRIKALLDLKIPSLIKIDDQTAVMRINSGWEVKVTILEKSIIYEARNKGKSYNPKKDPGVPQDVIGVIDALDEKFKAALIELMDGGEDCSASDEPAKDPLDNLKASGFEFDQAAQEVPAEVHVVDEGTLPAQDNGPDEEQLKKDQEEKARLTREENEKRLREAEAAKLQEEEELEKLRKENEALKAAKEAEEAERLRVEFPPALKRPDVYEEHDDPEEEVPPVKKGEVKLLDILYDLIEDDLLQVFGHTGTGKTSIAMKAAMEARELKKSVIYIDTEHNITKKQAGSIKKLGVAYEYIPKFDNLYTFIKKLPKYDVVVVDSLGLPVLSLFAEANMKEKGNALMKMIAISSFLKNYANENRSLVIVLNQPESDMNKDPNTERKPFGDKSSYCYKEIISSKFAKGGRTENKTTIVVKAFRSRSCGMGTKLFTVEITAAGVKVIQ
jgi:RecA/RadA recombinase